MITEHGINKEVLSIIEAERTIIFKIKRKLKIYRILNEYRGLGEFYIHSALN